MVADRDGAQDLGSGSDINVAAEPGAAPFVPLSVPIVTCCKIRQFTPISALE